MLNNLRIKNFRMLEDLEIPKLGRVNLIVGKNNSGKSTILEALRIYAGHAHPYLLREILVEHDEFFSLDSDTSIENRGVCFDGLRNFFPNRQFPKSDNNKICIETEDKSLLTIEHVYYFKKNEKRKVGNEEIEVTRPVYLNQSDLNQLNNNDEAIPAFRITLNSEHQGLLNLTENTKPSLRMFWGIRIPSNTCFSFVSTTFFTSEALAKLWDQIALTPNQDRVIQALKIIDLEIEGLAFVKRPNESSVMEGSRLAIAKLKKSEIPVPLNSMGDGMSRILQLILSVFPAKDGFLLIDEFELGLHYSVQEQVWRIVFELAKELNIQVFATTHSWDCIESFTKVAVESPEEGVLLKVSKSRLTSDNGKVIATVYDESELQTITASDLEVR